MILSKKISVYSIISGSWKYLLMNVLACSIVYILFKFFNMPDFEMPALIPSILGTALAFFIAFTNNHAYERWWEARKTFGAVTNISRAWTRQLLYFQDKSKYTEEIRSKTKTLIYRQIAFIYALKQALRKSNNEEYKKYISDEDLAYIESESNKANALLTLQARDLNELYDSKVIDGFKYLEFNKMLNSFNSAMGGSERISNTVFPTTYDYYTRVFTWVFVLFVTLVTAENIGIWSIPTGALLGFIFLTIHNVGLSLINPFKDITSGVPLNQITRMIEINMLETLKEKEIPKPEESVKGVYIM
jgi:putative membrane protein